MKKILFTLVLLCCTRVVGLGSKIEEVEFISHGDKLSGSIVFPVGKIQAAVVFVHGSGMQTRNMVWAENFAKEGIACLVYDKRGVGKSGGSYEGQQSVSEKNIVLLADDAVSALNTLSNHPALKGVPFGLTGISQAGWIVPLAAEKSRVVNFIVLWSGPVCKVSEEDIFSKYTADRDAEKVPAFVEALNSRKEKYIWPDFLGKDTDPSESLAKLKIPGLWIFGERDGSVPVDLSIQNLKKLKDAGHTYDHVLVSGLGHNNMPETFATATDWIKRQSKDLVLVGTVTKIYTVAGLQKRWAIELRVSRVVSGEFSGSTFTFTVHSPSMAGLRGGRAYIIKAKWLESGYVVDFIHHKKRLDLNHGISNRCPRHEELARHG